jgi:lactate dehydrogenase-like 2-hydroxyacid dehydrogenase
MTGTRPRLLVTRRLPEPVEAQMAAAYDVTFNQEDEPFSVDRLRAAFARYDAICCTITDKLDAETIGSQSGRCRILANYGAGVDHIEVQAAVNAGLVVTNTPDVLTGATAELAIYLMLAAARRASEGERQLRSGRWVGWHPTHLIGQTVVGKTLGLIGFGRIAQATAMRAKGGFDMEILYTSRSRVSPEIEKGTGAIYVSALEELLERADIVSLHVPGGEGTYHLIDRARLAQMRSNAILINTARGRVVDEPALAAALNNGVIAAAGLDVYEDEPLVHPDLLACENAVLLPHLGSATLDARVAMGMRVISNLDAFFGGMEPSDRVS